MLNAVNLTRSFGNRQVLRGLSLTVEPAEIVSLVGINGAGKTTLLRVLANLLRPEQGMVRFGSYTPLNAPAEYRRHIGVVMHTSMLYDNLSARENLRFFSRLYQIADSDKRIRQVLEMVALNSRADELVRTFSRGMQQRLAIARALLHDPDLLLLDEPYTGLDQRSSELCEMLIRQAAADGKMVLLTTHDFNQAVTISTRVDLLHDGKISWSSPSAGLSGKSLRATFNELTVFSGSHKGHGVNA